MLVFFKTLSGTQWLDGPTGCVQKQCAGQNFSHCVGSNVFYDALPMPIDAPARHRLLLSLRSEAALGLRLIRGASHEPIGAINQAGEAEQRPADVLVTVQPEVGLFVKPAAAGTSRVLAPLNLVKMSAAEKTSALAVLNESEVSGCTKCRLCETRMQTVFGEGDVDAKIVFIGEGPGQTEDETGRPFVGRAGQLLDKMIGAMGLSRSHVYIANIVKCRPPENRVPAPDEVVTCTPYLVRQLEIVQPKVIVTLGLPSMKYMLEDPKLTMGRMRGQWQSWRGIKLMPTYHPSYVLRAYTEANRMAVWGDLQMVMKEIGLAGKSAKLN